MTDASKAIAFRVPLPIDEQIEDMAKAAGQTKSEWVREQVMQALHASTSSGQRSAKPNSNTLLESIESQIQKSEHRIRTEIAAVKSAILEAAKAQHDNFCLVAEVGQSVEESMKDGLQGACLDVLAAIEGLKQAHELNKETLLKAIYRPRRRPY